MLNRSHHGIARLAPSPDIFPHFSGYYLFTAIFLPSFLALRENEIYLIKKGLTQSLSQGEFICWIMAGAPTRRKSFWFLNPFTSANLWKIQLAFSFFSLRMKAIKRRRSKWHELKCFRADRFEWGTFHQRLPLHSEKFWWEEIWEKYCEKWIRQWWAFSQFSFQLIAFPHFHQKNSNSDEKQFSLQYFFENNSKPSTKLPMMIFLNSNKLLSPTILFIYLDITSASFNISS